MNRGVILAAALASLAACAQLQDRLLWSKGHATLAEGLRQYEDGVHLGARAHTDTNAFTILAQDNNGGLERLSRPAHTPCVR